MALRKAGNWGRVTNLIHRLGKEAERAQALSLKRFGLKAEGQAKGHISKQDLQWRPLKPSTIAQKIRKGYSTNILVATSSYFQAITSYVSDDTVYIGVRRSARSSDGVILANIAAIHEFGSTSGSIPARPLWKPTFLETLAWHSKNNRPEIILIKNLSKY